MFDRPVPLGAATWRRNPGGWLGECIGEWWYAEPDYELEQNPDGSTTASINKKCTIIILLGHGAASSPHRFKFYGSGMAGGFVGCDAGSTNNRIPEDQRSYDLKRSDGDLANSLGGNSDPDSYGTWYDRAREGAKRKAKDICKDKKLCCKKVTIKGEIAKMSLLDRLQQPAGWTDVVDCGRGK